MSEQPPENAKALNEEPEVEGHKVTEDPSVFAEVEEQEGPEVEGHFKASKPEDPLNKA